MLGKRRAAVVPQGMLIFGGSLTDPSQQDSCFLLQIDARGHPTSWVQILPDASTPHCPGGVLMPSGNLKFYTLTSPIYIVYLYNIWEKSSGHGHLLAA